MAKKVNPSDYTGKRYGNLVIKDVYIKKLEGGKRSVALCVCDCGNECEKTIFSLNGGKLKSCGCINHGMKRTRFYNIWSGMVRRCENENDQAYPNYGGRGIKICGEWREFNGFKRDMYTSYEKHVKEYDEMNTSIDRIDFNGNYEASNCRWATRKIQAENSRQVKFYDWKGENLPLTEIARREDVNYRTLRNRFLYLGWTLEESVNLPIDSRKKDKNLKRYDIFGEQLSLAEISRKTNISRGTLQSRLEKQNMTIHEAVTKPIKKRVKS